MKAPPQKAVHRYRYHELPAELVLTEITEEGPRAKVPASNVNNNRVVIGENEEEEEEDLDRYENGNDLIFE